MRKLIKTSWCFREMFFVPEFVMYSMYKNWTPCLWVGSWVQVFFPLHFSGLYLFSSFSVVLCCIFLPFTLFYVALLHPVFFCTLLCSLWPGNVREEMRTSQIFEVRYGSYHELVKILQIYFRQESDPLYPNNQHSSRQWVVRLKVDFFCENTNRKRWSSSNIYLRIFPTPWLVLLRSLQKRTDVT